MTLDKIKQDPTLARLFHPSSTGGHAHAALRRDLHAHLTGTGTGTGAGALDQMTPSDFDGSEAGSLRSSVDVSSISGVGASRSVSASLRNSPARGVTHIGRMGADGPSSEWGDHTHGRGRERGPGFDPTSSGYGSVPATPGPSLPGTGSTNITTMGQLSARQVALSLPFPPLAADLLRTPARAVDQGPTVGPEVTLPSWISEREYLSGDHVLHDALGSVPQNNSISGMMTSGLLDASHVGVGDGDLERATAPLSDFPPDVQEQMLIDDLLFAMLGLEGRYIRLVKLPTATTGMSPAHRRADRERASPGGGSSHVVTEEVVFSVAPGLHPALLEMVLKLGPLCQNVLLVQRFVASRSFAARGLVAQALAAAMGRYLRDWGLFVAQLEHQWKVGRLSLQRLLFYCRPAGAALSLLGTIATGAAERDARGAVLLNQLVRLEAEMAGNASARGILREMLALSSEPYLRILQRWVHEGVLDDPHGEFMVEEVHYRGGGGHGASGVASGSGAGRSVEDPLSLHPSQWWGTRFTCRSQVPIFLEPHASLIMTTGKYLTARSELLQRRRGHGGTTDLDHVGSLTTTTTTTGGSGSGPQSYGLFQTTPTLRYSPDPRPLREALQAAGTAASRALRDMVMVEGRLWERLTSLRRFMLGSQGDFLLHFIDLAGDELAKNIKICKRDRVQSLLEMAIRTTAAAQDPFADDFTVTWDWRKLGKLIENALHGAQHEPPPLATASAPGVECLVLDMAVDGPSALVLNPASLKKYSVLFKHLFFLKNHETRLANILPRFAEVRGTRDPTVAANLRDVRVLIQNMLHFMKHYQSYMFSEILDPKHEALAAALARATTVDEIIAAHHEFLDSSIRTIFEYTPESGGGGRSSNSSSSNPSGTGTSTGTGAMSLSEALRRVYECFNGIAFFTKNMDEAFKKWESVEEMLRAQLFRDVIIVKNGDLYTRAMRKYLLWIVQHVQNDQAMLSLASRLDYNGFLQGVGTGADLAASMGALRVA